MKSHIPHNDEFKEGYNPYLKQTLLDVVDNQLRENDPITLERLTAAGYTEQQAKEKIAAVVIEHIYDCTKFNKPFNGEKYVKDLSELK